MKKPKRRMKAGIKCPECGTKLFSFGVHNFRECHCGNCFIDGGDEYTRVGFRKKVPKTIRMERGRAEAAMKALDKKNANPIR